MKYESKKESYHIYRKIANNKNYCQVSCRQEDCKQQSVRETF